MNKRKGGPGRPRTMSEFLASRGSVAVGSTSSSSQPSQATSVAASVPLPNLAVAPIPAQPLQPSTTPSSTPSESSHQQQVRGHNKGVPGWNTGGKIEVEFNDVFQPVGDNAKRLKSQLGIIVRDGQKLPLTNLDWSFVDDSIKERIWAEVQRNVLNVPEGYKEVCLRTCNNMWKDYKAKTKKKYFTKNKNDPDLAKKCPPKILPDQWVPLVGYWQSSEAEKQSQQNSKNRDRHGPSHVTGRKSFAEVKYELQKSGQPVDKMSVWIKSRNIDDPDVIAAIKDYNDLLSMEPDDQQELTTVKDKIFHQVIGVDGHGYCRTYGCSAPPRLVYPGSSSTPTSNEAMFRQLIDTFTEQVDKKLQDFKAEIMLTIGSTDRTSAHSQAQTTSAHLLESIGDGVIIVSPNKGARDTSIEGDASHEDSPSEATQEDDEEATK